MRIGILGHGLIEWNGGIDFIRLITDSLKSADHNTEIHFILPIKGPLLELKHKLRLAKFFSKKIFGYNPDKVRRPDIEHIISLIKNIDCDIQVHQIDTGVHAINSCARKYNIDVLLPATKPINGCNIPWLGYITDYQHVYFPHFFSKFEIENRNEHFKKMLKTASHVIVNSKAVADDINKYNPDHKSKIIALPFSAAPHPKWLESHPIDLDEFGIANKYFMICNQFWQHKDHLTAWNALSVVLEKHPEIDLVCTGEQHDYRNPSYYTDLMEQANKLGIGEKIKCLGLIKKIDQISLMKNAIAVIQPSLFEGGPGGGAIYDSISLGIPSIVSDIKVNLELEQEDVLFFKANDANSLAEKMLMLLDNKKNYEIKSPSQLIEAGKKRRKMCGEILLNNVKEIKQDR